MNKGLLLDRIDKLLKHAKSINARMLIEVEPSYEKLYLYTDKYTYGPVQERIVRLGFTVDIKYTLTNEKMYYPYEEPTVHMLTREKGKLYKRFYDPTVDVKRTYAGDSMVYYVSVKQDFELRLIEKIELYIREFGIDRFVRNFRKLGIKEEYKLNRIGDNRLAIYRY